MRQRPTFSDLIALSLVGCGGWDAPAEPVPPKPPVFGLRVVNQHLENADGETVVLHGVNRSGTEYRCISPSAPPDQRFFDGPDSEESVAVIASSWNVNAVRVPLNESCWLGINGAPAQATAAEYQQAILDYVAKLHRYGLTPILDLHWVGPGDHLADRLNPLPDADHAPAFWSDVARTFLDDPDVVLELFNEPFPYGNTDSNSAWSCWRDGCETELGSKRGDTSGEVLYQGAGMGTLLKAVRDTGATHLVLIGGVQYSNSLSQWAELLPADPLGNTAAAWHVYDNNPCIDAECWNGAPATVAGAYPVVATEFGQRDCESAFVEPLMLWLDQHASGYLAWSWNAYGECRSANAPAEPMRYPNPWSLVESYDTGAPNGAYATAVHDHLETFR